MGKEKIYFDFKKFANDFSTELTYGDSLRGIGKQIGVSASTLSRLSKGKTLDIDTILKVSNYMNEDIRKYCKGVKIGIRP